MSRLLARAGRRMRRALVLAGYHRTSPREMSTADANAALHTGRPALRTVKELSSLPSQPVDPWPGAPADGWCGSRLVFLEDLFPTDDLAEVA